MPELSTSDTPILDLLERMTADSVEASSLDAQTIILVRLAALVASDAPAVSYPLNLAVAGELGLTVEERAESSLRSHQLLEPLELRPRPFASWKR